MSNISFLFRIGVKLVSLLSAGEAIALLIGMHLLSKPGNPLIFQLITHGYRVWEYGVNAANKFCINTPLFVVNKVKLAGLFLILLAAIALRLMG